MSRRAEGFTLLEVLVALAVLAIAMGALIKAAGDGARVAAHLEMQTLAHQVALNQLARMRIAGEWPAPGTRSGRTEEGGQQWPWSMKVESTDDPQMRRVILSVETPDGRGVAAMLVALLASPAGQGAGNAPQ